jgi:phytoene dehydrogenase-like protein
MNERTQTADREFSDVIIVGGGLAGLAAAALLARAGRSVTLFEKAPAVGGRAMTETREGFRFNLGPHALYCAGRSVQVLRELGVKFSGGKPSPAGNFAIDGGVKHTLPSGFFSLLTTGLFGLQAKLETARLLASIGKLDTSAVRHLSVREWLERELRQPEARRLLAAIFRVSTYAHDPERQSAGAALEQLQLALAKNVYYLDGGWQTLVDGLREAAQQSGARIVTGAKVALIERGEAVRGVRLADGTFCTAESVLVAASPQAVSALVERSEETVLREWAEAAIPVRAACLDVALKYLPQPHARFALGIDRPLYLSVHSAVAQLAPAGGALIQTAQYLGADAPADAKAVERELESLLDLVQPGWREAVAARRFLPSLTVSHALVTAAQGGAAGRPGPEVPGIRGLYVAGDWVGPEGMLADASLASGQRAAALIAPRAGLRSAAA